MRANDSISSEFKNIAHSRITNLQDRDTLIFVMQILNGKRLDTRNHFLFRASAEESISFETQ